MAPPFMAVIPVSMRLLSSLSSWLIQNDQMDSSMLIAWCGSDASCKRANKSGVVLTGASRGGRDHKAGHQ
jgi:hypothetical protein